MYQETKAYVRCHNLESDVFINNIGIKQGCNVSCLIFALYLNDLEDFMFTRHCDGISLSDPNTGSLMLMLLLLLYADDSVILSHNKHDLQYSLQVFNEYCTTWKLQINANKSKILIFGRDRKDYVFTLNGITLEKVKTFKYLGVMFSGNGRYIPAIKHNVQQANKAAFSIASRSKQLNLSPSCQIHIINTIVKPILLYGCEVFCFDNIAPIEQCYIQCLKRILRVNKSTPTCMVYNETGCRPIKFDICERALSFFIKVRYSDNLANQMQTYLIESHKSPTFASKYLDYIYLHIHISRQHRTHFSILTWSTAPIYHKTNYHYHQTPTKRSVRTMSRQRPNVNTKSAFLPHHPK